MSCVYSLFSLAKHQQRIEIYLFFLLLFVFGLFFNIQSLYIAIAAVIPFDWKTWGHNSLRCFNQELFNKDLFPNLSYGLAYASNISLDTFYHLCLPPTLFHDLASPMQFSLWIDWRSTFTRNILSLITTVWHPLTLSKPKRRLTLIRSSKNQESKVLMRGFMLVIWTWIMQMIFSKGQSSFDLNTRNDVNASFLFK